MVHGWMCLSVCLPNALIMLDLTSFGVSSCVVHSF